MEFLGLGQAQLLDTIKQTESRELGFRDNIIYYIDIG